MSNGVWANISVQLFYRKNYSIFWNCTSSMHQFFRVRCDDEIRAVFCEVVFLKIEMFKKLDGLKI